MAARRPLLICGVCKQPIPRNVGYASGEPPAHLECDNVRRISASETRRRLVDVQSAVYVRVSVPGGVRTVAADSECEGLDLFYRFVRASKAAHEERQVCFLIGPVTDDGPAICPPGTMTYDYGRDTTRDLGKGHAHQPSKAKGDSRSPDTAVSEAWREFQDLRAARAPIRDGILAKLRKRR